MALLISQRVKPGREADFRAWESEIATATRRFEGSQGIEVYPPVPGIQDEWVVLVLFRTQAELQVWLTSEERTRLLAEGEEMCLERNQVVMAAPQMSRQAPVAAVISCQVRKAREEAFLEWQGELEEAERAFPGFLGTEVFRPRKGVTRDWTILFRYDSDEHLEAWLQSEERQRMLRQSEFREFELHKVASSFGGWFDQGERPPNWKQGMAVLLALYPIVMLINLVLVPHEVRAGVPLAVALLVNNVVSTTLLSWPGMPLVNRVLGGWLYEGGKWGALVCVAGYLLTLATFWLASGGRAI